MRRGFAPIIAIAIVAAFLIGIGATVAYFRFSGPNKFEIDTAPENTKYLQASSPIATPATSTAQKDETANWKTYNSNNYSLKYPINWQVYKLKYPGYPGLNPPSIKAINDDEIIITEGDHYPAYNENIAERVTINFRNDIIAKDLAHSMTLGTDFPSGCKVTEITVSNTKAFRINCIKGESLLIDSGKVKGMYQIDGYFVANSSTIDQILSTFRFL